MCETTDPTNAEIARVLDRIADLLEGMGENPHRIRAYRDAAYGVLGVMRLGQCALFRGDENRLDAE